MTRERINTVITVALETLRDQLEEQVRTGRTMSDELTGENQTLTLLAEVNEILDPNRVIE